MFEQLKIKVAVRQSIIWGIVLFIALFLVFSYNVSSIYRNVEKKLNEIADMRYYRFLYGQDSSQDAVEKSRDTMAIFVSKDGKTYVSDENVYDEATLQNIIATVMDGSIEKDGYLKVGENKLAYKRENTLLGSAIYLCDYTDDFNIAIRMMIVTIAAGTIGIVAIALISVRWAKRNIAPVESAFEKQQELVANASHELKTPITIINTDLTILNGFADSFTEEQKKWLDNIGSQVSRMSKLVGEMLELARLEANGKNLIKEDVNLSTVAECVVLESEALAFERNVNLVTDIKDDVCISAVSANIEKLIYILVENALKYTPADGTVKVSVSADRKRAKLAVRNTGDGIKKEDIPKLFDRFYRVDESHGATEGFGLGLAIAKSIVDLSGGKIGVDSKEGEYTEFVAVFRQIN
ncbi:MAG: sensor histidine kinase [Christensenellales bacterium]